MSVLKHEVDFLITLKSTLEQFHQFQLENDDPYEYNTLGLAEWLEFDKKVSEL